MFTPCDLNKKREIEALSDELSSLEEKIEIIRSNGGLSNYTQTSPDFHEGYIHLKERYREISSYLRRNNMFVPEGEYNIKERLSSIFIIFLNDLPDSVIERRPQTA